MVEMIVGGKSFRVNEIAASIFLCFGAEDVRDGFRKM